MSDQIIAHIARAMIEYDASHTEKSWKELATVAYTSCMQYLLEEHVREVAGYMNDNTVDYFEYKFRTMGE